MKKLITLCFIFSFLMTPNLVAQQTVYVQSGGSGDGTSESTPYGNFSNALADINSEGDILRVIGDINLAGGQNISSKTFAFTIEGDSDLSSLTGADGITRMFTINGNTNQDVTFKNIIFTGATNQTGNGSILFSNQGTSSITIDNCLFNGNSTTNNQGGAIYLQNADLTVSNSTFYNNSSVLSGGVLFVTGANAEVIITNSTFYDNTIGSANNTNGAAIRSEGSATVSVINTLIYNNKTSNGGESGLNGTSNSVLTSTNSLIGFVNNLDTDNSSNVSVNLSNTTFTFTSPNVTFTAPNALTDNTPIDFGSDTEDVGAWDSKINIFKATTNNLWNDATNWSNGALPTSTDNVAVLQGAEVTLDTDATIVDVKVKAPIKINSGKSLIVTGEVSGDDNKVYYKRNLTAIAGDAEGWHLVASPVSGETYNNAYADAESLATSTTNTSLRGLGFYDTANDTWSYLVNDDSNAGTFSSGSGYTMKRASTGIVKFIGNLNTDDLGVDATISTAGNGFNLLGNPYTAFINSQTFLTENTNIDQQIWVWDQTGGGNYEVKIASAAFEIAPGQGFFVKANSGTAVNFAESNQSVQGTDTFLRTNSWTEVKLLMTDGEKNRFTKLYFTDNATTGFDAGWEGEVFGGIQNEIDVFTHLVEESQGKKYQVQSLPLSDLESLVIPVGVTVEAGKTATFSIENTNVPSNINVYIEDKQDNSFTLLEEDANFSFTPENNLDGIGRFYIHTTTSSLSADDFGFNNTLSIYTSSRENLRVVGVQNGTANIQLYNILGKEVLKSSFEGNGVNDIALPKLNSGVYIVKIATETGTTNKKIIIQ